VDRGDAGSEGRRRREPSGERYRIRRERSREPTNRYPSYRSDEAVNTNDLEHQEEISKVRSDYEFKIAMLEKQLKERNSGQMMNGDQLKKLEDRVVQLDKENQGLQNDYDRLKSEYDKLAKDAKLWEQKTVKAEQNYAQLSKDFDLLKKDFDREQEIATSLEDKLIQAEDQLKKLDQDYIASQKVLDNMKKDNAGLLSDIQALKEKQRQTETERDNLQREMSKLKNDLQRANETITKQGNVRSPDIVKPDTPRSSPKTPPIPSPTASIQTVKEDESVQDAHFRDYQKYANELLALSKKDNKAQVLGPMKGILLTCKQITQECENREDDPSLPKEDKDALIDVKQKLSESLTHLMAATKEHASQGGPKTAAKIEEEVSRLSFCISDLIELMKIIQSNAIPIKASAKRDTLRSAVDGNGNPTELPPFTLVELRVPHCNVGLFGGTN
jgi:peptidoglycan hydrolase CwlO-like protein